MISFSATKPFVNNHNRQQIKPLRTLAALGGAATLAAASPNEDVLTLNGNNINPTKTEQPKTEQLYISSGQKQATCPSGTYYAGDTPQGIACCPNGTILNPTSGQCDPSAPQPQPVQPGMVDPYLPQVVPPMVAPQPTPVAPQPVAPQPVAPIPVQPQNPYQSGNLPSNLTPDEQRAVYSGGLYRTNDWNGPENCRDLYRDQRLSDLCIRAFNGEFQIREPYQTYSSPRGGY